MSENPSDADEQSLMVNQLIAEFMSRTDAGEALTPAQFMAEHPEQTAGLKRHFSNVDQLEGLLKSDAPGDETRVGTGNVGEISTEDATTNTVVRGTADSETSVTRDHRQQNSGSSTKIDIPETFGRYAIQKVLGQGAMGAVYLARDTQLDRDVALKIPKFGDNNNLDNEELLARFYREARASATLRSPNICPVHDVGEIDGQHYITMAYIEGRPLKDFTKSKKSHSEKQIITTIRKLALGLAEAHKIGVIHRDLKPANIMVDLKGEPVVMDFGLARRSSSDDVQVTQSGAILGTPAYMAPEQVAGDQAAIDHRVDIYALGIIMYELITGEMPFQGNLMSILQQIAINNPKKPSELRKEIDPRLETICLKMMAGDQSKRYQSMNDVAADLQDVLRNPGKRQKKEQAKNTGPKPTSIPSANEESNPALISVAQPKSYAEQLREKKGKSGKTAKKSTQSTKTMTAPSQSKSSGPPRNLLITGGVGGVLLLLGIIFTVRVGKYDVQIILDDPTITLSVDGEVLKITDGKDVYKLTPGPHKLMLQKDGFKTHVEDFTVTKDGKTAVRAVVMNDYLDGLINGERPPVVPQQDSLNPNGLVGDSQIGSDAPVSNQNSERTSLETSLQFSEPEDEVTFSTLKDDTDELTIELWLQRDSTHLEAHSLIAGFGDSALITTNLQYALDFHTAGGVGVDDGPRGGWDVQGVGQPIHIAGVRDPQKKELRIYYDGKLIQTSSGELRRWDRTFQIAGNQYQWTGGTGDNSFSGWIDEMRISKAVRYTSDFTPERHFAKDNETAALYHFDEGSGDVLKDASGNGHDGKIIGAKWVKVDKSTTLESFNAPLEFDGIDDHVRLNSLTYDGDHSLTVEMWFEPGALAGKGKYPASNDPEVHRSSYHGEQDWISNAEQAGLTLLMQPNGRWALAYRCENDGYLYANSNAPAQVGRLTHVAGVIDLNAHELRLYVDGQRQAEVISINDVHKVSSFPFFLGADPDADLKPSFPSQGRLFGVRFSNSARYSDNFTPDRNWSQDDQTLAVYHFDEGSGDVLKDFSGNGHDGKIIGAKWVQVEPRTTSTTIEQHAADRVSLEFNGKDVVHVDSIQYDPKQPFTLEAAFSWQYIWELTSSAVFVGRDEGVGGQGRGPAGGARFAAFSYDHLAARLGEVKLDGGDVPRKAERVHLAIVHTGKELLGFRDGKLFARAETTGRDLGPGVGRFLIGKGLVGKFEMLRLSKTARYDKDFVPQTHFAPDDQTIALYNFDKATGDVLKDSSGNGHDGKIIGAKWVKLDSQATIVESTGIGDAPSPAIAPFDAAQAKAHQLAWADYLGVPVEYENSIGMKFRLIPPGEFLMGSTQEEIAAALHVASENEFWREQIKNEFLQHKVILTQPVYVGMTEVTQTQYKQVMGTNPSHFSATGEGKDEVANLETSNHPVEMVSWNDAAEFCAKLSQHEELKPFYLRSGDTVTPLDGTGYRLPTEAEWEHACRAGTTTRFWSGDEDQDLFSAGWRNGKSGGRTHAAGELKANPFGLSDVHGNVWEWVQDSWDPAFYGKLEENAAINPSIPFSAGSQRVLRGGFWNAIPSYCRSSSRLAALPPARNLGFGFRVVLPVDAVKEGSQQKDASSTGKVTKGWPTDAPSAAIAPFDADQAKAHQQAWAKYLGVPVEYTNSIGMQFRLIPSGEFLMGSTPGGTQRR